MRELPVLERTRGDEIELLPKIGDKMWQFSGWLLLVLLKKLVSFLGFKASWKSPVSYSSPNPFIPLPPPPPLLLSATRMWLPFRFIANCVAGFVMSVRVYLVAQSWLKISVLPELQRMCIYFPTNVFPVPCVKISPLGNWLPGLAALAEELVVMQIGHSCLHWPNVWLLNWAKTVIGIL